MTSTKTERIPEPLDDFVSDIYRETSLLNIDYLVRANFLNVDKILRSGYVGDGLIIDAASGIGALSFNLAKRFPKSKVVGIDTDEKCLSHASHNFKLKNLEFTLCDVMLLKETGLKSNLIVSSSSMHEFVSLGDFFQNVYSSLIDGGMFYFSDLNREGVLHLKRDHGLPWAGNIFSNTEKIGHKFYEMRKEMNNQEFILFLKDEKRVSDFFGKNYQDGKWQALFFSSFCAAYTPREVLDELSKFNFSSINILKSSHTFGIYGHAIK